MFSMVEAMIYIEHWCCGRLQLANDILDVKSACSYYPHNLPTFSMWFPTTVWFFLNGWLNQLVLYCKSTIWKEGSFQRYNLMINTFLNRTMFCFYIIIDLVTLNNIYCNQNHGLLTYFKIALPNVSLYYKSNTAMGYNRLYTVLVIIQKSGHDYIFQCH